MGRKIYFLMIVLALIFSIGCSTDETTMKNSLVGIEKENTQEANPESIDTPVVQDPKLKIIRDAVSPNGNFTAYIVSVEGSNQLFLGQGGDFQNAKEIKGVKVYYNDLNWSPNSKFFFAGYSDIGYGAIFSVQDSSRNSISFQTGPVWSPDGNKVCFTRDHQVWLDNKNSIKTYDVVVMDLGSKMYMPAVLAEGTEDYYFKVNSWHKDGEIIYQRISMKDGRILANLSSQYAHYLWAIDFTSGARQTLGIIADLGYRYFNMSPDRKWLSMIKITFSGGEAEGGIPTFYNLETGELRELGKEYITWFWNPAWLHDSTKIMLNETSIYDMATGKLTEYELPEGIILLGAKPSPDGSKLAVFGCKQVHRTSSQGEPIIVYILSLEGKVLNTIQTSLLPNYSNNLQGPVPVKFDWLADNQKMVIEAWDQKTYAPTLQKLEIPSGGLAQLAANTISPTVSPDGKKIAVLSVEQIGKNTGSNMIKVLDSKGTVLNSLEIVNSNKILWDDSSESILVMGYSEGNKSQVLVKYNIVSGESGQLEVEKSISPVYIDNEKIVCIGGPLS